MNMDEEIQKTSKVVMEHSSEIVKIREKYPDISQKIENFKKDFAELLKEINKEIDKFPEHERDLITVLVVNGIHKMTDEIFIP